MNRINEIEQEVLKLEKEYDYAREDLALATKNAEDAPSDAMKEKFIKEAEALSVKEEEIYFTLKNKREQLTKEKRKEAEIVAAQKSATNLNNKTKMKKDDNEDNKEKLATKKYSYKAFDPITGKSYKEELLVKSESNDYDPLKETTLFLKGLADNDMSRYKEYKEEYKNKAITYYAYNTVQDTAATDLAGTAPGYHLESGDAVVNHGLLPTLLYKVVETNIYAGSAAIWLVGGLKQAANDQLTYLFDELSGLDWIAEGELKPDLKEDFYSIRVAFKKIAGKVIYSEEMVRFDTITMGLIEKFAARFARAVYAKLDRDFISGAGGDSIVGLADTTIRGKAPTGRGQAFLAPLVKNSNNFSAMLSAFTSINYDIVDNKLAAKAVFHPDYLDKLFLLNSVNTTGGKDQIIAQDLGLGLVGYKGFQIKANANMFSNRAKDGIVGVINLGGVDIYTDNASSPFSFLTDPYTLSDRNLYRIIGDFFCDVVVENKELVILIKDTFTLKASAALTSTGPTNLAGTFTNVQGVPESGVNLRVFRASDGKFLGMADTGANGAATFTLAGAAAGDKVVVKDNNDFTVATGTLG